MIEYSSDKLDEIVSSTFISLLDKIPKPENAIKVLNFEGGEIRVQRLFTLGNISAITGKQKSKKSLLASLLMAASSGNTTIERKFKGVMENKTITVYIDTEQARYDSQKVGQRIVEAGGNIDNVNIYCLREYTPKQRLAIIERIFTKYGEYIGLVVLDGVADLCNSINDEVEATMVANLLMKWTSMYNFHITTIIHQNKGDAYATGHIGSAIMKKSECVISIKRNDDQPKKSLVECTLIRGVGHFSNFEMEITERGLEIEDLKNLSSQYKEVDYD
jgi:hypothetical protein